MITAIKKYFKTDKVDFVADDFSDFFHNAKSADKKKLIKTVMRDVIAEQNTVVENYKAKSKTAV